MNSDPIERWHQLVATRDVAALDALLAEDAEFLSPIVHTPQRGKALAKAYLGAALTVFASPAFRYVREIRGTCDAMLEFETVIDGIEVNGVDIIRWDASGRIVEFKVMIRPLKAINRVHDRMAEMLAAAQRSG